MVGRQMVRHQSDETLAIPPCCLEYLVCGSVEVEAVDVGGFDDVPRGSTERVGQRSLRPLFREPDARGEMDGRLRLSLVGQSSVADQPAICD